MEYITNVTNIMHPTVATVFTFTDDCLNYGALDNSREDNVEYKKNILKRVISIAIPILSLYRPLSIAKHVVRNICLITKNSYRLAKAQISEPRRASLILDTTSKVFFLVSAILSFHTGLFICGGMFVVVSTIKIAFDIDEKDYKKAVHHFLDLATLIGLIATMVFASLEVALIVGVFTICYSIYKSIHEFKDGRIPEGITRVVLNCLDIHSAANDVITIAGESRAEEEARR